DACYGRVCREGAASAEGIRNSLTLGGDAVEVGKQTMVDRGWAEDVLFAGAGVRVRGSIEATAGGEVETCHRLRGILSKLLEAKTKHRVRLAEVECASMGARECVFEREGGA